jgi:hypothetical protein
MSRQFSPALTRAMNGEASGEAILPLVKLTQSGWQDSIRLVPNWEPITHVGEVYSPLAFEVSLPDEEEEGVPVIQWVADNVDLRLVEALRTVQGAVLARIVWVLASQPDVVELGPLDVTMRAAEFDALTVAGVMGVEPILEQPFGYLTMSPETCPALF